MMSNRIRILILIRDLGIGGAERQVVNLITNADRKRFEFVVVTFYDEVKLVSNLEVNGVTIFSLGKTGRWDVWRFSARYLLFLWHWRPRIVHGFMEGANLLSLLGRLFGPRHKIVWGIRRSNMGLEDYDWTRKLLYKLEYVLGRFATLIVANSNAGKEMFLLKSGTVNEKVIVVNNGIDTAQFIPSIDARIAFRCEINVPSDVRVIGLIARHDPKKDHKTFIRAAEYLSRSHDRVRFVVIGSPVNRSGAVLRRLVDDLGLSKVFLFLEQRDDINQILNGFDIATLTSAYGEGFPNVLAEAMAVGVMVVSTNVGDSARIIGSWGEVVAPGDYEALAAAWSRVLAMTPEEKGIRMAKGMARIEEKFAVESMVMKTQRIYSSLIS